MGRVELLWKIVPDAYALAVLMMVGSFWLRTRLLDRFGVWAARIGLLLHTVWVVSRWKQSGLAHPPWITRFESAVFFSWALMAAQFYALVREDVKDHRAASVSGSCILAIGLLLAAWRMSQAHAVAVPVASLIAYGFFAAIAFGWLASGAISALFAWIASSAQSFARVRAKIAEPAALERMSYRAILQGLPIQLLALLSAGIWGYTASGSYWNWEHKQVWSLVSLIFFVVFVHEKSQEKLESEARAPELAIYSLLGLFFALIVFGGG